MPPAAPSARPPLAPAFAAAFRLAADKSGGPAGALRFDDFVRLALYHPELGYYQRNRTRVGRSHSTDFYTATSLGPIFGELVAAAAAKLLRVAGRDPAAHTFVEIGAEPGGGVLAGLTSLPFGASRTVRLGEPLTLSGACVVFSNELFDAQPFRRFQRAADRWHETGVALSASGDALVEIDLGPVADEDATWLPPAAETPVGYRFDAPLAAAELASRLAKGPWHGLFIAFDYGRRFAELAEEYPEGTARGYHRQNLCSDLLEQPGEQDLTVHVCWDWLESALTVAGCSRPVLKAQESFFVHHAGEWLAGELTRGGAAPTDPRRRSLQHLLHPAQMGRKFQVLHALKL